MVKDNKFKHILITAGPTREYLDPVRFLSNESSGRMGFALAEAARQGGAKVTLICGPVDLPTPTGVQRIDMVSGREMFAEVKKMAGRADLIIMAAAVADFRPSQMMRNKIKKDQLLSAKRRALQVVPNPDILAWLGKNKRRGQVVVGFALETKDLLAHARKKIRAKGCDWIVANHARVLGSAKSKATLLSRTGRVVALPAQSKKTLAAAILKVVLK